MNKSSSCDFGRDAMRIKARSLEKKNSAKAFSNPTQSQDCTQLTECTVQYRPDTVQQDGQCDKATIAVFALSTKRKNCWASAKRKGEELHPHWPVAQLLSIVRMNASISLKQPLWLEEARIGEYICSENIHC